MARFSTANDPLLGLQEALDQLTNQFQNGFWNWGAPGRVVYPAVNVFEKEGDWYIFAEIPGLSKNELEVNAEKDTLRISGNRLINYGENISLHRRERNSGVFDRTFQLPFNIDPQKTTAEYKDGILKLRLVRAEKEARKIPIK